jgi:hypothetical protein
MKYSWSYTVIKIWRWQRRPDVLLPERLKKSTIYVLRGNKARATHSLDNKGVQLKPFAMLGSEIGKVRESNGRSEVAVAPKNLSEYDLREKLLARLGEHAFRLIAQRKLDVPGSLRDTVDKLASVLGVQIHLPPTSEPRLPIQPESQAKKKAKKMFPKRRPLV